MNMDSSAIEHVSVLAEALAEQIKLPQDAVMVDATIGHGGHSLLFGKNIGPDGLVFAFDIDENSLRKAKSTLKDLECRVIFVHSNFSQLREQLRAHDIEKVDFILADLGVCSAQLTDTQMGLSFLENMPLDMRLDKSLKTTAADIVNTTDEKSLADLIYKYGEDRASRRIARFIVSARLHQKITTTGQLAAIVCKALSRPAQKQWNRIHPATRTFQALRIAVNHELENLEKLLAMAPGLLKKDGRI